MKLAPKILTFIPFMALIAILAVSSLTNSNIAYAQTTSEFTVLSGDQLKNNPLAQTMLERIEIMKQRIAEMQEKQNQLTEHQKFIEEQRKIAKQKLNEQLKRMDKDYEQHTPRASFSSFVSKMPTKVHDVYWGMFDYQRSKVKAAQEAMKDILNNGGSYHEAREAYNEIAGIKKVELIEVTKNLNVKYGLADRNIQDTFDKNGKLPRYDD